jgi:glucose 1-dehydrogenase
MASVFSDADWQVIGVDILPEVGLPGVCRYISADISEEVECERVFAEVIRWNCRLHALVNNAAIQVCKPVCETTQEEWDRVMNCNVRSAFLCSKYAHPILKIEGGGIINVSSVHAIATSVNIAAYAASKGAILSLTRALAIEFAPDNIRVNAVLPGATDTQMLRAGLGRSSFQRKDEEALLQDLAKRHVLQRVGRPEEIAKTTLFLADSSQSSFITGQAIVADGGALARLSTE